jgi:iron complex transport system substrate-binding protein
VELLDFCAGRNVAAEAGQGSLARVSLEQILLWNPEVIVTQDAAFARRVLSDPLWRGIAAVRERRVHCAPALPFGWLDGPPGINRLIGVRWLLERLHPGHPALRALEPFPEAVRRFYQSFYGASLAPQEVRRLLDGI